MYKINDKVVYKGDVCIVKDIKEKYFKNIDYYVLSPINDFSLTINAPTDSKDIRTIISKEKALELIDKIPSIKLIDIDNEKYIEKEYKDMLSEQTYDGLIKIIKTAYLRNETRINNNKKISEKDDTYFKVAEQKLYDELSIALNIKPEEVKKTIINTCNKK